MEIQEFRDRCARAMGGHHAVDIELGGADWKPPYLATFDNCEGRWWLHPDGHLEDNDGAEWKPDEDYNQAMMMRDRCEPSQFYHQLHQIVEKRVRCPAFSYELLYSTAKEIAEAALVALEGRL